MKEVTILGTGASRSFCSYDCETWGVNGAYMIERHPGLRGKFRMDKLFLTDYLFRVTGQLNFDVKAMNSFSERNNCQMITLHKIKGLNASLYPYKRIVEKFGTNYFTSSICYMLAYALDKDYELIKLYGVDMSTVLEYYSQKPGVEFWIGMAMMKGCTLDISQGSTIMAPPMGVPYGFRVKYDLKQIDPYNLLKGKESK